MENPRPEKVAVVDEVKAKFDAADTVLLTEYRGLDVPALADLRRELHDAGGEYKIYKNTLVRFAAREAGLEIEDLLTGPTAIAFIGNKPDGSPGDAAAAAKALREFSKKNAALVVKGGLLGRSRLDETQIKALADLPAREVLLAQVAGSLAAPMQQFAGLLQALPRNLAYGLKALIEKAPAAPVAEPVVENEPTADAAPVATPADAPGSTDNTDHTENIAATPTAEEIPATPATEDIPATPATEDTPATPATEDTPAPEANDEQEN